ncbi:MAG: DUF4167 domain-containing protein [Alphaproteobacteria bacterium]|nr:DUF4167 domain-containing protein [Alphaproteobacteria bacterium]
MRHNAAGRRPRNRGHNGRRGGNGQPNRMQVFDSNGPDVRIRGTAAQIYEKYSTLAKDAASVGDYVLSESYLQHAEHYQRLQSGWIDLIEGRSDAYLYKPAAVADEESFDDDDTEIVAEEGDLGLPASIIGTRTSQTTSKAQGQLEDA